MSSNLASTRSSRPAASAAADANGEFSFGKADFDRVRELIYKRAGINLHEGKQAMVYSRLSRRLRETGIDSFARYLDWLQGASGAQGEAEWQEFTNALTTNLTSFFREPHHFESLVDDLRARASRPLRIWCNATSTGEEPYSIAMVIAETLGASAPAKIFSTDIDTNVLAQAQRGVYEVGARGLSQQRLLQHFLRGTGANAGFMRVKPELQRMIEFAPFNLIANSWNLGEAFDLVFCRNVMIYFDHPTQRRVLERMHAAMKPGALLYAGHSENFTDATKLFRLRGKTIYERL